MNRIAGTVKVKGLVLRRPRTAAPPLTETLPKTLLPLDDGRTILDLALANLRSVGIEDVVVVTGFAADRVEERAADLERRHGVRLELVFNERAEEWNNAYSLWLAREAFADGAACHGDTRTQGGRGAPPRGAGPGVLLAIDGRRDRRER